MERSTLRINKNLPVSKLLGPAPVLRVAEARSSIVSIDFLLTFTTPISSGTFGGLVQAYSAHVSQNPRPFFMAHRVMRNKSQRLMIFL
jgi:hypothetical protein